MKPIFGKYEEGLGELYSPLKLRAPNNVEHYVEYHGSHVRVVNGETSKQRTDCGWTGFGEYLCWPLDGTWQGERCRADVFENATGFKPQRGNGPSGKSPWYFPMHRNLETRAILKLAEEMQIWANNSARFLYEACCRVDVLAGRGLWDMHGDDFLRTVVHAVEYEKEGRCSIEESILHSALWDAVHSWDLHGNKGKINPDYITVEEMVTMVAITRLPQLIAGIRDAIEAERPIWLAEIEPWAYELPRVGPVEQPSLFEEAS